jgi:hypothetical protein
MSQGEFTKRRYHSPQAQAVSIDRSWWSPSRFIGLLHEELLATGMLATDE